MFNSFPDSGTVLTNQRLTAPAAPTGSPTISSLFLDTGGSLAIGAGNTIQLRSGNLIMAAGTAITGSAGTLSSFADSFFIYVGPGTSATFGTNIIAGSTQAFAKTGPGSLDLTAAITGASAPVNYAVQRGTLRFATGGSIPTTAAVSVDAGATLDINGTGSVFEVASLNGLGNVQLGSTAGTVLRVSPGTNVTSFFGGAISGTGSFEKAGAGIFEFTSNSYSGPITLSAGTLRFGGQSSSALPIPMVSGGTISAADGTTLSLVSVQDFQRPLDISQGRLNWFRHYRTYFAGDITSQQPDQCGRQQDAGFGAERHKLAA